MVKVLDRESINRMTGNSSGGGGGGGGSVDIDLSGYATKQWTEEYYINKEFFSSLFKAYDANGNEVNPNDTATPIDNIKAMFGFWTDFYISALGRGQGGGALVLNQPLSDINAAGLGAPTQANVGIVWNGTRWVYGSTGAGSVAWSAITNKPTTIAGFGITDAKFGTVGSDYVPITLGGSTYNVLNRHQSLSGYATESWADGRFLKLSGGTLTGLLNITTNSRTMTIGAANSSGVHIYNDNHSPTFFNGGVSSNSDGSYDLGSSSYKWNVLYINRVIAHSTTDAAADSANAVALITGSPTGQHLELDGNEIMSKATGTTNGVLYLNAEGGNCIINEAAGNCGIGTGSPSYKLHVVGVAYASTGVYSAGYVTALSDIRKKDVIEEFVLKTADIAKASLIKFTWKDKHDTDLHAGGIAQEWQKILPESVRETEEGVLAMDYGVIAVAASVSLAREVVSLQKKVNSLEKRLLKLEKMFAINDNDIED